MEMLKELKGQNGIIYIYPDYIEISRKTLGGFVSQGGSTGNRRIYYSDINAVEYKTPTKMTNGYIKIIVGGTSDTKARVGILSSSTKSAKDPNTLILRAFKKSTSMNCDKAYELIMEKLNQVKSGLRPQNAKTSSNIEELKKLGDLLDSGILTQEEFDREKAKLLS